MDSFLRYMYRMDTYIEMTQNEQFTINFLLECAERNKVIVGTPEKRCAICQAIYNAYLAGIEKGKERTV